MSTVTRKDATPADRGRTEMCSGQLEAVRTNNIKFFVKIILKYLKRNYDLMKLKKKSLEKIILNIVN